VGAQSVTVSAGSVSLVGGSGSGAYAAISGGAGGVLINAGSISLIAGTGVDANAGIVSIGPVTVNGASCTGCAVLTSDPAATPGLLAATGLYGFPVSGTALTPVTVVEVPVPPPPEQVLAPPPPPPPPPPADAETTEEEKEEAKPAAEAAKPAAPDDDKGRKRRVPKCS
jgi:hypothetical protein